MILHVVVISDGRKRDDPSSIDQPDTDPPQPGDEYAPPRTEVRQVRLVIFI